MGAIWLAYLPTLFLFSYVSNLSGIFLATILSVGLFMVYPFIRIQIIGSEGAEFETHRKVIENVDKIMPTSLPLNLLQNIKGENWLVSNKCRYVTKTKEITEALEQG